MTRAATPMGVRQRDVFGKRRIAEQTDTSGRIDVSACAGEVEADDPKWAEEQGLDANPPR